MAIVDPSTGLIASYAGISNAVAGEGNFSAITDADFSLSAYSAFVTDTSCYGVVAGNMGAAITGNRNWDATAVLSNQGVVYGNDEKSFSGLVSRKISCAGSFTATDLMTTAQAAAVGTNGGLIHALTTFPAPVSPLLDTGTGLVLSKLQFVKPAVGAPFAGKMFLIREAAATSPLNKTVVSIAGLAVFADGGASAKAAKKPRWRGFFFGRRAVRRAPPESARRDPFPQTLPQGQGSHHR